MKKDLRHLKRRELVEIIYELEKQERTDDGPALEEIEAERRRIRHRERFIRTLNSTVSILIVVAAVSVLVATLWMPVLKIYGGSMAPTLEADEIVVSVKNRNFETGDIVAFWHGNKLLVKRCIAGPGQWVDLDEDGNVTVDGEPIEEPYLIEKAFGECDLELPYQVPESRWFLMGDNRATSLDSRSSAVGCIADEQVVGRIVFRVWPFKQFGRIR